MRAAKLAMARIGEYPDPRCQGLREYLAAELGVEQNHLVFGNGAAELIYDLVRTEKPKKAVIAVPSFAEYERALNSVDCWIQYYTCREENGFVMQEDFMDLLTEDVDMVFLCSPGNPAGTVIPKILMRKIMIRCEFLRIRLVLDQCFFEFMAEDEDDLFLTFKNDLHESTKKYPSLFLLRAFTKMYAMPGLRLGYGICQDERLLERMEECRQPWSVSIPAQEAGIAAIKDQKRVRNIRGFLLRERRWLEKELDKLRIPYFPSKANYILLKSELDLYELLKEYRILIRDCSNFRGLRKGFYRIAVRQRGDNQKLIDALQEIYEAAQAEQILREMEEEKRLQREAQEAAEKAARAAEEEIEAAEKALKVSEEEAAATSKEVGQDKAEEALEEVGIEVSEEMAQDKNEETPEERTEVPKEQEAMPEKKQAEMI